MHAKEDPLPDGERQKPSALFRRTPLRSKTVNTVTFVAGLTTAGIGLLGMLAGARGAFDAVLLIGGLLVAVAGLVLRGRSSRT